MAKKERSSRPRLEKTLPDTWGQILIKPGEDWLEMFNNFLSNTDHYETIGGKLYFMKKGKKPKLVRVKNEVQKKTSSNRRNTVV